MDIEDFSKAIMYFPGNIYCKDIDGKYLNCNESQAKFLDVPREQLIGKNDYDFLPYELAKKVRDNDNRIIKSGIPETVEEECIFNDKKFIMISHKAPLLDNNGKIIGIAGTSIDITEQKKNSDRLYLTLTHLITHMPAHIYFKDINGVIIFCNNEQAKYFGFNESKNIVGKSMYELYSEDIASKIHKEDRKIINGNITVALEESDIINGIKKYFLSYKSPLKDPDTGEVVGILGVSIDITKQKELEETISTQNIELARALEVKTHFLNNMSHEVRTPLVALTSITEVLEDSWDELSENKRRECFKMILEGRDRLMSLLDNLLDLSKFHQGKAAFEFRFYDIKILIIELVDEFKDITHPIDLHIHAGVETFIQCDSWRIKQVLRNLIANCVKHGGENKPIHITLSKERNYMKVSISDEGVGIPESDLEVIFEPFVESKRTKRGSGGTGMGLSLCKDIIIAHKGKIWAENNVNIGSTFHFTLPYDKHDQKVYTLRLTTKS